PRGASGGGELGELIEPRAQQRTLDCPLVFHRDGLPRTSVALPNRGRRRESLTDPRHRVAHRSDAVRAIERARTSRRDRERAIATRREDRTARHGGRRRGGGGFLGEA